MERASATSSGSWKGMGWVLEWGSASAGARGGKQVTMGSLTMQVMIMLEQDERTGTGGIAR